MFDFNILKKMESTFIFFGKWIVGENVITFLKVNDPCRYITVSHRRQLPSLPLHKNHYKPFVRASLFFFYLVTYLQLLDRWVITVFHVIATI